MRDLLKVINPSIVRMITKCSTDNVAKILDYIFTEYLLIVSFT